jgi:TonB family protein
MSKDVRFWRNVALIGVAHIVVIYGLIRWSREPKSGTSQSIVWMNGGAGDGGAAAAASVAPPRPVRVSTPPPEVTPAKTQDSEEDQPVLTSARSDIQLPPPKPSPTATPRPKPSPTPVVKATPKSTPKPKPTPKPSPKTPPKPPPKKTLLAKASPKPSPKLQPAPGPDEKAKAAAEEAEQIRMAKAVLEKAVLDEGDTTPKRAIAVPPGTGKGKSSGAGGGHAGGAGGESQFGWYGSMLHDRFYSEWAQPTTNLSSGAKVSALVKLRIEKDGRVSKFEIIKPSGNATVDDSVEAVAKSVTQVDPLPAGLGNGEHYDVKINFELNAEQ